MKLSNKANVIVLCFSILSVLAQSVYALSAPCPDMPFDHGNMNHSMMQVDSSPMDHSQMDHGAMTTMNGSDSPNCCGEDSCPMNACGSAVLFNGPHLKASNPLTAAPLAESTIHYASANVTLLYRPPILA